MGDRDLFENFGADRSSHQRVTEVDFDKEVTPANPSFTVDPKYPGAGIKRPQQGGGKATGGNVKSKYGKKPKKNRRGRSGDATGSDGAISSGGPGGSMG